MAITITAPPPELPIARTQDIEIFIRADSPPLERAVVTMDLPGLGRSEQVHNGSIFKSPYTTSLREPYTDSYGTGFHYVVRRDHGWPDGPVVRVVAYDTAGGEAIL